MYEAGAAFQTRLSDQYGENRVTGRNRIRVSEVNVGSFRFEAGRLREYTANGIGSGSGRVD